jgi:hypothetical protein
MAKKRQANKRKKWGRGWPTTLIVLGLVSVAMGAAFCIQGTMKYYYLKNAMRQEKITVDFIPGAPKGEIIDSAQEALLAANTIQKHRRAIAPTYSDLMGGKKFDPTNPKHLTYAQALNLEQYLYLAFMGFSITQIVIFIGVFMIIAGIAIGGTGITLYKKN